MVNLPFFSSCKLIILLCALSQFFFPFPFIFIIFRYVKSRSDQQLLRGLKYNDTSSCQPEEFSNGHPIVPCGLIAWSLFNDTYKFIRGSSELRINRKNIAWKSDRDHKFGKHVYPLNFQNGTLIGGGSLDPSIPVSISDACKITLTPLYLFYRSQICCDRPNYDILYPLESTPTCCGISNFSSP